MYTRIKSNVEGPEYNWCWTVIYVFLGLMMFSWFQFNLLRYYVRKDMQATYLEKDYFMDYVYLCLLDGECKSIVARVVDQTLQKKQEEKQENEISTSEEDMGLRFMTTEDYFDYLEDEQQRKIRSLGNLRFSKLFDHGTSKVKPLGGQEHQPRPKKVKSSGGSAQAAEVSESKGSTNS